MIYSIRFGFFFNKVTGLAANCLHKEKLSATFVKEKAIPSEIFCLLKASKNFRVQTK